MISKDLFSKCMFINNKMIFYNVFYWPEKVSPHPSVSLCDTPSLFLNGIMKNRVLNQTFCSTTKNFNATLLFAVYNKCEKKHF
jgi:hypothetical protein